MLKKFCLFSIILCNLLYCASSNESSLNAEQFIFQHLKSALEPYKKCHELRQLNSKKDAKRHRDSHRSKQNVWECNKKAYSAIAFADEKHLYSGDKRGNIRKWNIETGRHHTFGAPLDGSILELFVNDACERMAIGFDSKKPECKYDPPVEDCTIHFTINEILIKNMKTKKTIFHIKDLPFAHNITLSRDGSHIMFISNQNDINGIFIYSVNDQKQIDFIPCPHQNQTIHTMSFNACDNLIAFATATEDRNQGSLFIYNAASREMLKRKDYEEKEDIIDQLLYSHNGKYLAIISDEKTQKTIWDTYATSKITTFDKLINKRIPVTTEQVAFNYNDKELITIERGGYYFATWLSIYDPLTQNICYETSIVDDSAQLCTHPNSTYAALTQKNCSEESSYIYIKSNTITPAKTNPEERELLHQAALQWHQKKPLEVDANNETFVALCKTYPFLRHEHFFTIKDNQLPQEQTQAACSSSSSSSHCIDDDFKDIKSSLDKKGKKRKRKKSHH